MPTLTTRLGTYGKGSALSHAEMDANWKRPCVAQASNYNLTVADNREFHELANGVTATLPTASTLNPETDDWEVTLKAVGASATVGRNSQTIDGAASDLTLSENEVVTVVMNADKDGYYIKSRHYPAVWTTPAFDAGNFTASGSMTWTVASGNVTTYAYIIRGKEMTVAFRIGLTTVSGTPSTELRIAIPASKTATKTMSNPVFISDNGSQSIGYATAAAGGTYISIIQLDGVNFSASTNNTYVYGQITIEID